MCGRVCTLHIAQCHRVVRSHKRYQRTMSFEMKQRRALNAAVLHSDFVMFFVSTVQVHMELAVRQTSFRAVSACIPALNIQHVTTQQTVLPLKYEAKLAMAPMGICLLRES